MSEYAGMTFARVAVIIDLEWKRVFPLKKGFEKGHTLGKQYVVLERRDGEAVLMP